MLYFPQLLTGNVAQFPIQKRLRLRTVSNETLDGTLTTFSDAPFGELSWTLRYSGLTMSERESLETLFRDAEGQLLPFVFIDPTGNMFQWSEKLDNAVWDKSPSLQLSPNSPDPLGGERGTRFVNAAQIEQSLSQEASAPAGLQYCLSLSARSENPTTITLRLESETGNLESNALVRPYWTELSCSGVIGGSAASIHGSISFEAGAIVDVFGIQLHAQPSSSTYRPTTSLSAVAERTYLATDELQMTADGIDNHSCEIRLVSYLGTS